MSANTLCRYDADGLRIEAVLGPDGNVTLTFAGSIEHPNPGVFLDPLLNDLHQQLLHRGIRQITADFRALAFLNSSGIKPLIKWVLRLNDEPAEKRYAVTFLYAGDVTWQQTSLKAITMLGRGSVLAKVA